MTRSVFSLLVLLVATSTTALAAAPAPRPSTNEPQISPATDSVATAQLSRPSVAGVAAGPTAPSPITSNLKVSGPPAGSTDICAGAAGRAPPPGVNCSSQLQAGAGNGATGAVAPTDIAQSGLNATNTALPDAEAIARRLATGDLSAAAAAQSGALSGGQSSQAPSPAAPRSGGR